MTFQAGRKLAESTQAKQRAEISLDKSERSSEMLEDLLMLLDQIEDRNLAEFARDLAESDAADFDEDIAAKRDVFLQHKIKFEKMRDSQNNEVKRLQAQLEGEKSRLKVVTTQKIRLQSQVENLETIKNTMPDWCHKSDNVNEIADTRLEASDISEQS